MFDKTMFTLLFCGLLVFSMVTGGCAYKMNVDSKTSNDCPVGAASIKI